MEVKVVLLKALKLNFCWSSPSLDLTMYLYKFSLKKQCSVDVWSVLLMTFYLKKRHNGTSSKMIKILVTTLSHVGRRYLVINRVNSQLLCYFLAHSTGLNLYGNLIPVPSLFALLSPLLKWLKGPERKRRSDSRLKCQRWWKEESWAMENLNMIPRDRLSPVFICEGTEMWWRTVAFISRAGSLP